MVTAGSVCSNRCTMQNVELTKCSKFVEIVFQYAEHRLDKLALYIYRHKPVCLHQCFIIKHRELIMERGVKQGSDLN